MKFRLSCWSPFSLVLSLSRSLVVFFSFSPNHVFIASPQKLSSQSYIKFESTPFFSTPHQNLNHVLSAHNNYSLLNSVLFFLYVSLTTKLFVFNVFLPFSSIGFTKPVDCFWPKKLELSIPTRSSDFYFEELARKRKWSEAFKRRKAFPPRSTSWSSRSKVSADFVRGNTIQRFVFSKLLNHRIHNSLQVHLDERFTHQPCLKTRSQISLSPEALPTIAWLSRRVFEDSSRLKPSRSRRSDFHLLNNGLEKRKRVTWSWNEIESWE